MVSQKLLFTRSVLIALTILFVTQGGICDIASRSKEGRKQLAELQSRANKGFTAAQIELARAYFTGRGVARDPALAAHWYEEAAKAGDSAAQVQVGFMYQAGMGVRMDPVRAFHWYQLSSASGFGPGKVNLAVAYLHGMGVRKDPSAARQLFEAAVEKKSGLGAAYLGTMEYLGLGGPVNIAAAEEWWELGVKLHDPVSACDLSYLYSHPAEHPADFRRAADLLRRSSDQGYVRAKHGLGVLLVNHPELPQSDDEPALSLQEASRAGDWKSSALLGALSRDGNRVKRDVSRAFYYFYLARLQGGNRVQHLVQTDLEALSRKLPAAEQAKLAAEADAWHQEHPVPLAYVLKEGDVNPDFPMFDIPAMDHTRGSGQ